MKNIYIGIDPDLRTLNCALLLDDPPVRTLLAVFIRRNKTKLTKDDAVACAVRVAQALVEDVLQYFIKHPQYQQHTITMIAESQSMQHTKVMQDKYHKKIDPDDTLHTGQIIGILMGVFSNIVDVIHLVQPSRWKKQVKKPIHHPRILNHLKIPYKKLTSTHYPEDFRSLSQYSGDKVNPGDFEDINDSIGLALYGAENNL